MSREIRKVPKGWQHPKNERGYQPVNDEYYLDALSQWITNHNLWLKGEHPDQLNALYRTNDYKFYAEWGGNAPEVEYYRTANWTPEEASCFQYYEIVSEGTPLSPVFDNLIELENWLVDHEGHSRDAAKEFCTRGYAPSMVIFKGEIKNGVDVFDIKT